MMQTQQNKWVWIALIVTLALSWEALRQPAPEISQPTRSLTPAQTLTLNAAKPMQISQSALHLSERTAWDSQYNLFATPIKVSPPASQKIATIKPPPPQAPPLPFVYLGRIKIGENEGILLDINEEVTPVQQGDVLLGGQYRVQTIQAKQIQFLYQPLNQLQTLSLP